MSSRECGWCARAAVAIALLGVTGCSFATMTPVPRAYRIDAAPRCTNWPGARYADYGGALVAAIYSATGALVQDPEDRHEQALVLQSSLMTGLLAGVYVASAVWGKHREQECVDAFDAHEAWLRTLPAPAATAPAAPAPGAAAPTTGAPGGAP